MHMTDLIEKKKRGGELSDEEIRFIIRGYTAGEIPDYQMSALMMAILFRGMTVPETTALTLAMAHSGDMVDLSALGPHTADKHSTGGVGDKTSLVLCPMVAACGGKMAKMSGRGLGHTGGTIDKLEAFPGFSTAMSPERFLEIADTVGFVIAGQTANLAPADKKMYALRDVTATVNSIPLIVSSIMSKKLASGARTIVLDVKTGSGAFMETEEDAFTLAREMVNVGRQAGRNMAAVVTDMDQPLGFAVGNALEVKEAIAVLRGEDVPDLRELCLVLGSQILTRSGISPDEETARAALERSIGSGAALRKLADMVEAQGGDPAAVYDPSRLPAAPVRRTVRAPRDGYITAMEARAVGLVSMHLGGGRATKEDVIDLSVGVVLAAKAGACLRAGDPLAEIHAASETAAAEAEKELLACYTFGDEMPVRPPFIRGVVS
ncbi:MAG: thymidine phosphorylase [Oscillospiraceae bacterium]|nr:thymidine phosphorylase [Oscillospiraceae bacterium]